MPLAIRFSLCCVLEGIYLFIVSSRLAAGTHLPPSDLPHSCPVQGFFTCILCLVLSLRPSTVSFPSSVGATGGHARKHPPPTRCPCHSQRRFAPGWVSSLRVLKTLSPGFWCSFWEVKWHFFIPHSLYVVCYGFFFFFFKFFKNFRISLSLVFWNFTVRWRSFFVSNLWTCILGNFMRFLKTKLFFSFHHVAVPLGQVSPGSSPLFSYIFSLVAHLINCLFVFLSGWFSLF